MTDLTLLYTSRLSKCTARPASEFSGTRRAPVRCDLAPCLGRASPRARRIACPHSARRRQVVHLVLLGDGLGEVVGHVAHAHRQVLLLLRGPLVALGDLDRALGVCGAARRLALARAARRPPAELVLARRRRRRRGSVVALAPSQLALDGGGCRAAVGG
eukprot:scaffold73035_cov68-Phaeocystis_antarctica.AAC.9